MTDADPAVDPRLLRLTGTTLADRYQLHEIIGRGGMGVVFRATQLELDREVAVKVLHPDHAAEDEARLAREAASAARLDHPNCVHVFEYGQAQGLSYIAMTMLQGQTLGDTLATPRSRGTVVRLALQILRGLQHAHGHGVVHRDIKPGNLFLTAAPDGSHHVTIVDFGLAKLIRPGTGTTESTMSGLLAGTPAYMSPEQALGVAADARSDLYSVGIVLYRLLAGYLPFATEDAVAQLRRRISDDVPRLPESVPPALAAVVHRLCEKERDARYQSASEALADLERIEAMRAASSSSMSMSGPAAAGTSMSGPITASISGPIPTGSVSGAAAASMSGAPGLDGAVTTRFGQLSPPSRLSKPVAAAFLGLAILAAGGGGWLIVRSGADDAAAAEGSPKATAAAAVVEPDGDGAAVETNEGDSSRRALHILASVNDQERAHGLGFEQRHAFLDELAADPKFSAMIDMRLNTALDLAEANEAPTPCQAFGSALDRVAADPGKHFTKPLASARVPTSPHAGQAPDTSCDGLADRLRKMRGIADPPKTAAADSSRTKRRRAAERRRSRRPAAPRPEAKEPPVQPPAAKPKKSSAPWERDSEIKNPYK